MNTNDFYDYQAWLRYYLWYGNLIHAMLTVIASCYVRYDELYDEL
jgi:hypothetical protein